MEFLFEAERCDKQMVDLVVESDTFAKVASVIIFKVLVMMNPELRLFKLLSPHSVPTAKLQMTRFILKEKLEKDHSHETNNDHQVRENSIRPEIEVPEQLCLRSILQKGSKSGPEGHRKRSQSHDHSLVLGPVVKGHLVAHKGPREDSGSSPSE